MTRLRSCRGFCHQQFEAVLKVAPLAAPRGSQRLSPHRHVPFSNLFFVPLPNEKSPGNGGSVSPTSPAFATILLLYFDVQLNDRHSRRSERVPQAIIWFAVHAHRTVDARFQAIHLASPRRVGHDLSLLSQQVCMSLRSCIPSCRSLFVGSSSFRPVRLLPKGKFQTLIIIGVLSILHG